MPNGDLSHEQLERLRQFDTCTLSNAIERLNIRPRNEGFITGAVTCRFPQLPPVIGYAVTARMRSSMMPIKGRCYYEHPDLWRYVASLAGPRILVIQDADDSPGVGALLGEAYARISRALGCVACVTNGAVRDVPGIEALGFQVFAGGISVSHAYAHVMEFGEPVEIGGLRISSGRPSPRRSAWGAHDSDRSRPRTARHCRAGVAGRPGTIRVDRKKGLLRGYAVRQARTRVKRHLCE